MTISLTRTPTTPPAPPGTTTLASYAYRGDGLLITRSTPNEESDRFTWDDSGGIPNLLQVGNTSFTYGPEGRVVSRITAGVVVQVHTDRLGSVVATTNPNGTRVASVTYTAWGSERSPSGDTGELGFTGEYTDPATGFIYLRARWYDPATAEFITRDPVEHLTGDPYSYAANSPLAYTDPLGLWPSWDDIGDAVSGAKNWVEDNRHAIVDVATTVGTVAAIGAVCGATAGVGCVAAVGVGAAVAGTVAHKGADALVDDDNNDVSWGGAAGRSAVNAAAGATCTFTLGQGCGPATIGRTTINPRSSLSFATRWTFRTPASTAAGRWAAGTVWGSTSLTRWLIFEGAGWRCHAGQAIG